MMPNFATPNFATPLVRTRHDKRRRAARGVSLLLVCVLPLAPGVAGAQAPAAAQGQAQAGLRPSWLITPAVSVEGTYTDNVNLAANKKADFITRLSPGITLDGKSGRASASLNYQWQQYIYAENSALNNQQRSLAAKGQIELVERWLFLEGSHNIAQRTVSAFSTQGVGNELINANRSETAAYSISPYIQGRLAGVVDYQLRYSGTSTRSDTGPLSGDTATTTRSWTGRLAGATPLAPLGWSLNADNQISSQSNAAENRSSHMLGTLTYQIDPQVRVRASAGRESNNFTSALLEKRNTTGIGLDWAPTERTNLSLKKDRNAAGNSFGVDFSHRTALSAWKFSDSRSISLPTPQLALAQAGTAYDLTYLALTSRFPDPAERAAAASQILAQAGIAPNATVFSPILTSQASIQRRQQASVALFGANNTVIFAADRSNSERMGTGIGLADDFALNSAIRQSGFNTSWTHKMTPHATLTLNGSASRNTGSGNPGTSLKAWSLLLTTQLGLKASASVGLRQSRFNGGAPGTGYDEQALTGSMQLKF